MVSASISVELDENIGQYKQRPIVVYLASPLSGVSQRNAAHCRAVRKIVKQVLSRSSSAFFLVYDPAEVTAPGSDHSDSEVYITNLQKTLKADIVIVHAHPPSIGVGIELQLASSFSIPALLLQKNGNPTSRMVTGMPSFSYPTLNYHDVADCKTQLEASIPTIARDVVGTMPRRRRALDAANDSEAGKYVLRRRIQLGMTRKELAEMSGVDAPLIQAVEEYSVFALAISWFQWHILSDALGCQITVKDCLDPEARTMSCAVRSSLDTLADFARGATNVKENIVFRLWKDYREMQEEGVAGREEIARSYTVEDWESLYDQHSGLFGGEL